jgi:hypothetical protein
MKFRYFGTRIFLVASCVCFGGCATLFCEPTTEIMFASAQTDVKMHLQGSYVGELPQTLQVERQTESPRVGFSKPGYASQSFRLPRKFNMVALWDLFSTVISGGIDVLTGAWMNYEKTEFNIELISEDPQQAAIQRKRLKMRHFIYTNHEHLQMQLARHSGEHLDALTQLGAEYKNAEVLDVRKQLLEASGQLVALEQKHFIQAVEALLDTPSS